MHTATPATLGPLARAALDLAQAEGYSVFVEAAGQLLRVGPIGRPGRDLVITLGPPLDPAPVPGGPPVEPGQLAA